MVYPEPFHVLGNAEAVGEMATTVQPGMKHR